MHRHHRNMLWIAAGVVVLALALEVRPDQRVAFPFLMDYPLPESCASRILFEYDCPGCGLTRSLIHLAHGRVRASLAIHPVGWLIGVAVLLQFPYRLVALARHQDAPLGERFPRALVCLLFAALVLNWLYVLVARNWA